MIEITRKEFESYSEFGKCEHPDQTMGELMKIIAKLGEKFLHGAGLNKEREAFVAVLFVYAIRKHSKREWFIQQIQDPPDFYVISPTDRPLKEKPLDRLEVEIVEIRDNNLDSAIKTLERTKLINYTPAFGTILLIFINSKIGIHVLKELNVWIVKNKNRFAIFSEVYILFLGKFTPETAMSYTLVNVFKIWAEPCALKEEFNKGILFPHPLIDKYKVKFTD